MTKNEWEIKEMNAAGCDRKLMMAVKELRQVQAATGSRGWCDKCGCPIQSDGCGCCDNVTCQREYCPREGKCPDAIWK